MPVDYSKWNKIEISDDEDEVHPNIDTPSLFRLRHQSRLERMADTKKTRKRIQGEKTENEAKITEVQAEMRKEDLSENRKVELEEEMEQLKTRREQLGMEEAELQETHRKQPWNVDTIGRVAFSKSRINKAEPSSREPEPLTPEEEDQKMVEFLNCNAKDIQTFGMLSKWKESRKFLLARPFLSSEKTVDYLTVLCLKYQMDGLTNLMERAARQCVALQFLLQLSSETGCSPDKPWLIARFFEGMENSDDEYLNNFEQEVRLFRERVIKRAEEKKGEEAAAKKKEFACEVLESLPTAMRVCFDQRDVEQLKQVADSMDLDQFSYHFNRCVQAGLWEQKEQSETQSDEKEEPGLDGESSKQD